MKTNMGGYEEKILELLERRGEGKTICPSEVLFPEEKKDKELMAQVRLSARNLVSQNKIVITQKGKEVGPFDFKGPIRLKLRTGGSEDGE